MRRLAPARDTEGREALLRYVLRRPVAQDRIHPQKDGLVRIALKRAFSDGTVTVEMDLSLLSRLATSVPPPRFRISCGSDDDHPLPRARSDARSLVRWLSLQGADRVVDVVVGPRTMPLALRTPVPVTPQRLGRRIVPTVVGSTFIPWRSIPFALRSNVRIA